VPEAAERPNNEAGKAAVTSRGPEFADSKPVFEVRGRYAAMPRYGRAFIDRKPDGGIFILRKGGGRFLPDHG
jgi:hypothetical protein